MPDFNFDGSKRFSQNCSDFLDSTKEIDPEMAKILEANWDLLLNVVSSGEREAKARTAFNTTIIEALDNLLTSQTEAGDE
ncbi:hypothetical protein ABIE64_002471 [Thalassospira sp. MBR-102]|jgi:hypothetical protein|uniref:hypothetical protein n=1 Tax=Thalassospira sp. MBR-102 TaxID=3156466 RepID=UPI00339153B1